jgi:uncharacterized RDD family membrane protein YckC
LETVAYRCVCGEAISLDTAQGGSCASCSRHYSPTALTDPVAQTMSLVELDSHSDATAQFELTEEDDWVGRELEHYRIIEPLGHGGMGQVYRALDQSLQRYVAIKVIRTGRTSVEDTVQLKRLFQEATAQARVNHPNIAHIYYVGRDPESPFLAMELVDGQTLAKELETNEIPFGRIVNVAIQIADALLHAIEFDIVHGDIKPSNILVTRKGRIKLADFGLAFRMSEQSEDEPTRGTPQYLAPEIAAGEQPSELSDMYSLGVTLFQLTFGRMPYTFSSQDIKGLMQTHREAAIEFPKTWPAHLPARWRDILQRMLAKSPEDRYQSYDELMADLARVQPISLPPAGRVQQGLAWLVDMALINTVAEIILAPVKWLALQTYFFPVAFIGTVVPILAGMMQARWGTTPGKKLFQVRIVDGHGLTPSKPTLATRMVFQMLPVWAGIITDGFESLGLGWVFWVLVPAISTITVIDAAAIFVRRDHRSLHDLIFRTRVALDASQRPSG